MLSRVFVCLEQGRIICGASARSSPLPRGLPRRDLEMDVPPGAR